MSVDALLPRLDGVKRTGASRWVARCPSHPDKRPSLSLREVDDGRILLHCFAGCSVEEILGAVGLEFDVLFSERALGDRKPRERRPFDPMSVLSCIAFEAELASVAADNIFNGILLSDDDRTRLRVAAARLRSAVEVASGE